MHEKVGNNRDTHPPGTKVYVRTVLRDKRVTDSRINRLQITFLLTFARKPLGDT